MKKQVLFVLGALVFLLGMGWSSSAFAKSEVAKLFASDIAAESYFGKSVAISGDTVIIGAYWDDDNGTYSGSAYIFQRGGSDWTKQVKLTPADGDSCDSFGCSVAISGGYAIVGAYGDDDNGSDSGSAYVFRFNGSSWVEEQKLTASDGYTSDLFGYSVSISGDYAIVGACYDGDNGDLSGSAYIFQRSGSDWTEQAKLIPSDGDSSDYFGASVAISGDYVIVGAGDDDDDGSASGSAYIFKRNGASWIQQDKLTASDGDSCDFFGCSVALSGDYAIVGANCDDDNGSDSGSAYIFKRKGASWVQQDKLVPSDGDSYDSFGYSVAISGDDAIVGAYEDDDNGSGSGSAYVFKRKGSSWVQQDKLTASDGTSYDNLGYSVALNDDYAIVGARGDDDNGDNSGSAYIFDISVKAVIYYVDADANGLNDGTSWENAYNYLQDALADADSSPKPVVIRVAQGTYNPYQSSVHPDDNGYHPSATFRLRNNVAIRGGYAGFGHPDPNARYVYAYETILSGKSNQSYHVVTALWVDETAILDGFTVTGGYAHGRDHYYGGGMFIGGGSGPTVMNCKFVKNSASTAGGIYIGEDTAPMIINCIFSQNRAYNNGGGIWNYYASPTLINCVFVDNSADDGSGGGISSYTHGMLTLINCTFSNNEAIWNGGGIYNSYSTTLSMTNCILWNNRDRHGVDESAQISGAISIINFCCIQGWTGALGGTGNIGTEPLLVDPDHDNCRLWAGSPCINAGDNSAVPLLIVTDADGNPRIVDGTVDMGAYELQHPPILYVDIDATGANDGSSWANAYNYLQDALADANSSHKPVEIWVAEGIYKPDQGTNMTPGDREATFQLVNRVSLMGGYAGYGEPEPDARNIVLYETILSGDLNSDDSPNFANNDENSYHVVTTNGTDRSAVLDGFTVTAGNANGSDLEDNNYGAGIYNYYGSPTLINCTISGNSATSDFPAIWACGGGIYSVGSDSSPTLTNCVFTNNSASAGGGMYSDVWSHPVLTSCKFICNRAREDGGGMYNRHSSNIATILTNCTFVGNSAGNRGGGMHNKGYAISIRLVNCIFSGNSAKYGGGMANFFRSTAILTNCTFNGNSALEGNALWCEMGTFVDPRYPSNLRLTNCILWDAGNEIWNDTDSVITLSYCNVHGGWPGGGNIDADPCFVMPGYWNADGVWINGVYYLLPDSPCIDAGTDAGVYDDIEGNVRPYDYPGVDNNGELPEFDMGAYEAVPLIEVPMKITPKTLNCRSKGKWIKSHLVLPAEFTVEDVNSNSIAMVHPLGIEPNHVDIFVNEDNLVEIEVAFGRAYLCSILRGSWFSEITITVRGSFTTGQYFYGMDTIRIIDNGFEYLSLLSSHWLDVNCSEPDWCDGTDINQDFTVNFNDFAFMACYWLENNNP